ncbi:major capsid family protein [Komagataeibacter europaeus]|uniref:major capsid family protein n=1 Tax=Komagataeibacter europaeus TaxID=33995 RepID=UPI0015F79359|nr:major capsid family protein [Komagataeibacter europaeus]
MMSFETEFALLAQRGFVMPEGQHILPSDDVLASDALAMDAAPSLSTTPNAGIPAFMATYVDPKLINVVFSPMRGAELNGEVKKGDWVTPTAIFPMIESTGRVASYGDWNNNGIVDLNANFPDRQSYHYQAFARWGEREVAMAGGARISWVAGLRQAAALKLNKFQNQSYFYGVKGLRNYGYLNDPRLPAAEVASTKAAGGTSWSNATPEEVTDDVINLINQLREQSAGIVETDSEITIGLSPTRAGIMTKPNQFGLSAWDQLKKQYSNLRFVQAIEFGDAAGMAVQSMIAIAKEIDGQQVAEAAFTEKLRTHSVVVKASGWEQKMSQGTWGAIIYMPLGVATMTGI